MNVRLPQQQTAWRTRAYVIYLLRDESAGFCQLDRRKTFFSLIKRPPSLGQQAHVTTSHSTNARVRSPR